MTSPLDADMRLHVECAPCTVSCCALTSTYIDRSALAMLYYVGTVVKDCRIKLFELGIVAIGRHLS
jgi:hypothetical protein